MSGPEVPTKNQALVEAGRRGMASRWGNPANRRIVRLDSLTVEERGLVLALIAAREAARRAEGA